MACWCFYLFMMGEILDGVTIRVFLQELLLGFLVGSRILRSRTGINQLTAQTTSIRTDIYQVVGSPHDFLVMLYDDYRIS